MHQARIVFAVAALALSAAPATGHAQGFGRCVITPTSSNP